MNTFPRRLWRRLCDPPGWIGLCVLAWAGAYICRESFYTESTGHFASMHGEWLAMARLVGLHWFGPRWWPYWGGGAPATYAYAPLVPFCIAAIAAAVHVTPAMALHILTGLVFCGGPVALYLAIWRGAGAPGPGFLVALFYALALPADFIDPNGAHGLAWLLTPRRAYRLFEWDDLPHQMAFALFPLAVWLLARALRSRRAGAYAAAAAIMALMMLASMFGCVLCALAALTAPIALDNRLRTPLLARAAATCGAAYLLACPWIPPSLLGTIAADARIDGESDWSARGFLALAILIAAWLLVWLAARRLRAGDGAGWPLRWAALYACPAIAIPVLDHYASLHFAPQPSRYVVEMELGFALAGACAVAPVVRRVPARARALLAVPLLVFAGFQLVKERRFLKRIDRPANVARSIEYRGARWLDDNLPGRRVMMPGSMSAWLNAFGDSPQLAGQSYSTAPNWVQQMALFTIYSDDGLGARGAEYSLLWLKAFGVAAVGVSGPHSPEYWKAFAHPAKFEGLLPVLWREEDTTIYGIPEVTASLAHAVPEGSLVRHKPINGADVAELRTYVAALEDPASAAAFEWRGANRAAIRARLQAGEAIATQVTYDPGWRATVNGAPRAVFRDGLGLLAIHADCSGECAADLIYDGGREALACYAACLGTAALGLAFAAGALGRVRRRAKSQA
ncbi:MAG TPA: hypothetical protein VMU19_03665 [Bryobacteraceae bacterium]|nr:hypothetical protein [Bryobacteraceae bacterium]